MIATLTAWLVEGLLNRVLRAFGLRADIEPLPSRASAPVTAQVPWTIPEGVSSPRPPRSPVGPRPPSANR